MQQNTVRSPRLLNFDRDNRYQPYEPRARQRELPAEEVIENIKKNLEQNPDIESKLMDAPEVCYFDENDELVVPDNQVRPYYDLLPR